MRSIITISALAYMACPSYLCFADALPPELCVNKTSSCSSLPSFTHTPCLTAAELGLLTGPRARIQSHDHYVSYDILSPQLECISDDLSTPPAKNLEELRFKINEIRNKTTDEHLQRIFTFIEGHMAFRGMGGLTNIDFAKRLLSDARETHAQFEYALLVLASDTFDPTQKAQAKQSILRLGYEQHYLPARLFMITKLLTRLDNHLRENANPAAHATIASDLSFLNDTANAGHPYALFLRGQGYLHGKGFVRDQAKAIDDFRAAMEAGSQDGKLQLAFMLYHGYVVPTDRVTALSYYEQLAEHGHVLSMRLLAKHYASLARYDKSMHWCTQALRHNDYEYSAVAFLDSALLAHSSVEVIQQAISYIQKAIDTSDSAATAMYRLGKIYFEGVHVPQDFRRARSLFKRATLHSHPEAQVLLALMNLEGHGQEKDVQYGKQLLVQATEGNNILAKQYLAVLLLEGRYFQQDHKEALKLFATCGESPAALYYQGTMHINGLGMERKNIAKGIQFLEQAANFNFPPALYHLGTLYHQGMEVPKDLTKGKEYLTRAANLGSTDAVNYLSSFDEMT